jgi:hypothetical protein
MQIEVKTIGPETAEQLLKRNDANRNLRPSYVSSLARQMTQGFWKIAGDPLRFDVDGNLLDGQHRLNAIIESNTHQQFVVIVGLDATTQTVMDSGIKRSFADTLRMRGESHWNLTAAITRMVCLWENGFAAHDLISGSNSPGNAALLATFERRTDINDAALAAQRVDSKFKIPARVFGFAWIQFGEIDTDDRDGFYHRLNKLEFTGPNDPISRFYVTMTHDAASVRRLPTLAKYALLIKTWNFYRDGAEVKNLRWRRGGNKPEAFPQPY